MGGEGGPTAFLAMMWKGFKKTVKVLLNHRDKGKRIHYLLRGLWDGVRLKRGKHPVL